MTAAERAINFRVPSTRAHQADASREVRLTLLIALAHLPLGLLLYNISFASILHPIGVLLIGLYWATNRRFKLDRVVLAVAYIVGAEVLWRMAGVPIFWEFGKYGCAFYHVRCLTDAAKI